MTRRPVERRAYIPTPREPSPRRRRRSRGSRDRERRRRQAPPFEHNDFEAVDMQISNGSDDEEVNRMRFIDSDFDPHRGRHRNSIEREMPMKSVTPLDERVREGIVFEYVNYYEFLQSWLDESNNILFKISKSPVLKRVDETITPTTHAERSRIILPAGVFNRNELLHCDMIITGLPPSVFFGSGFGHKSSFARNAAAKDLIDKCFRVGLITEALHTSIGNHPFFEKKDLPRKDYCLAVDALVDLDRKICSENWPWDLYTARELEPDTLDRLKAVFNSVMEDVYFHARERHRNEFFNSHMATNGSAVPCLVDGQEKTEFCHRCKSYGHMERYCRDNHSDSRERCRARSPPPPHNPRVDYFDERDHRNERYGWTTDVSNDQRRYTSDEIAQKISQQREELLRREMMLRQSEPGDSWIHKRVAPQSLFSPLEPVIPQPLMSFNGNAVHPRTSPVPPFVDPVLMEQQLRTARNDDMRTKLEAKARKLEEDKRLKQKEEELEWRMQKELEAKKRALEVEIRRKVQLEERAKLQMELSRTYQQTMRPTEQSFSSFPAQNLFTSPYPFSSFSSTFGPMTNSAVNGAEGSSFSSAPDFEMEEIKRLVKETEEKLLDLQRNCREAELSAIFQSRAFQTVAELGDNAHMLDRSQKQSLLRELKELLSHAGAKESETRTTERRRSRSKDRGSRRGCSNDRRDRRDRDDRGSVRRSRSRSRNRDSYKRWKESSEFKEVRVQVGGITLRNLSPAEQRSLKVGEIVVAQDMKTGKWTTARIVKVAGKRATLGIGNTTWKKDLDELYKEVPDWL